MLRFAPESRELDDDLPNTDRDYWEGERLETEYFETETEEFEDISVQLTELIITLLLGCSIFAVLSLTALTDSSPVFLLAVLTVYDVFFLLRNLQLYRRNIIFSRNRHLNNMIGSFSALVFYAFQLEYWLHRNLYFLFTLLPLCVSLVTKLAFKNYSVHGCQSLTFMILFFLRWIKFLTLLTIGISLDFEFNWEWYYLLWGVWLALIVLALVSIASLVLLVVAVKVRDLRSDEVNFYIWANLGATGSVLLMVLFVMNLESHLWLFSLINALFLGVYTFFTYLWKASIIQCLDRYCTPEDIFPPMSEAPLPLPASQGGIANRPIQLRMALSRPPKMLVRLSSTYYRPANFKSKRRSNSQCYEQKTNEHKRFASSVPKVTHREGFEVIKCKICWDRVSDSVIMPCRHGGICYLCAMIMFESKNACYMCRTPISRIFLVEEKEPKIASVVDPNDK